MLQFTTHRRLLNCHFEYDQMARDILFKVVVKFPGQS